MKDRNRENLTNTSAVFPMFHSNNSMEDTIEKNKWKLKLPNPKADTNNSLVQERKASKLLFRTGNL